MSIELEEIEMNTNWRERYISALEAKSDFLIAEIRKNQVKDHDAFIQSALSDYDYHSYRIEALDLEHRIFYEKKVLCDWKSQVQKTTIYAEQSKQKESNENFERVLGIVKSNAPQYVRLEKLLDDCNRTNLLDPEQREIMYSHFIRALQMLKIEII